MNNTGTQPPSAPFQSVVWSHLLRLPANHHHTSLRFVDVVSNTVLERTLDFEKFFAWPSAIHRDLTRMMSWRPEFAMPSSTASKFSHSSASAFARHRIQPAC